MSDREQELIERNELLTETLREARDQLLQAKHAIDAADKVTVLGSCLDYAIRAVDLRIRELDRSIMRGIVGTHADGALRLDFDTIAAAFEAALKAYGYEIARIPDWQPGGAA